MVYPPKGLVLSPQRGGFIPFKSGHKTARGGFKGGFIPQFGVVLCPGPGPGLTVTFLIFLVLAQGEGGGYDQTVGAAWHS